MTATTTEPTADPTQARGVLLEATDESIVFGILGTDYQVHLAVYKKPATPVGKRIAGTIRAQARRIDIVKTGGQYIEPVYGRPRRLQGEIIAVDQGGQTVTVNAGVPIQCKTDGKQRAESFKVGDFVSFDVRSGSSFTPAL